MARSNNAANGQSSPRAQGNGKTSPSGNGKGKHVVHVADCDETDDLQLPDIAEILEQVTSARSSKHGEMTYLDVAVGILTRFEGKLTEHREQEELRYLRACLAAGHSKTLLPARLTDDANRERQLRKSIGALELNGLGSVAVADEDTKIRKSTTKSATGRLELKSSAGSKVVVRQNFQHRGALHRTRYLLSDDPEAVDAALEAQKPLERCPWMGPVIPRWPLEDFSEDAIKPIDQLITQEFNEWGFDVFALDRRCRAKPLTFTGWEALLRIGAFAEFDLIPESVRQFLLLAEDNYSSESIAPYHNRIHAADVVQTVFVMMTTMGFSPFFDAMDLLVGVLAAVIHDVGHDGKSNNFHIDTRDEIAMLYNDRSLLENYALTTSFRLLADVQKGSDMLSGLCREQRQIFRKEIVDMVLCTDMSVHYQVCEKYREANAKHGIEPESWHSDETAMCSLRALVLHSCDISNLAKPFNLSTQWTTRCLQEMFVEGDAARAEGIAVSPLCDRFSVDVASSQIGFLSIVVQPTFELLARMVPKVRDVCLMNAKRNGDEWASRKKRNTDAEELQNVLRGIPRIRSGSDPPLATSVNDTGVVQEQDLLDGNPGDVQEHVDQSVDRCSCWTAVVSV